MSEFKNMAIELVNSDQASEVCTILEEIGYRKCAWIGYSRPAFITTNIKGFYTDHGLSFANCFGKFMKFEDLMEHVKEVKAESKEG
ncbi:hypothetical protein K5F35_08380 [Acinetobacter baumannii]|uniref:hypothetical protein n=1 Tax=Acinetobacter calcoaceticus/baumannii complex TaxID=909768 RepID=UPI001FF368B9|nr:MULTISPECIES: hypothetical protein [Acinetobacter calcoaceticus/baumannii complex]EMC1588892.1 hypothetical protein [Acinetobacter baumannii]MCJ9204737.1 hypothetical protein [Acinetobacter baumannii]MCJ9329957.1 hypothetical protein [Acinetobacter baumannii]MCZ3306494.1 hypothetical protein [Acinetobacter baumannii]HDI2988268.1 hypothetical protein [Acinetobacter baumannii]